MKISKISATNVHGYLPINAEFFNDLTFITGLNGSGKTTALRLIMALLTPNINELGAISFDTAEVTVSDEHDIVVRATKDVNGITLSSSNMEGTLTVSSSEMELLIEAKRRDEVHSPTQERYLSNPIYQAIRKLSTPMFLGLDRRFFVSGTISEDMDEARRQEYMARRLWPEDPILRTKPQTSLIEVNYLIVTRLQNIRAKQEQLDEKLRNEFFTKAFQYKPSEMGTLGNQLPSRAEVERYRGQLAKIDKAAEELKIPVPEIQKALTHFFERMTRVIDSLEKSAEKNSQEKSTQRKSKKDAKKTQSVAAAQAFPDKDFIEWIINKPQADKILEHLTLLDQYVENRKSLRGPIERFLSLVNEFLKQTNKSVKVNANGQVMVSLENVPDRPISALSSGERQLLVILAHLSLNESLEGSGIFIVDEPELSLHIDWQEKFVDSIMKANPNVQFILATHSPAIILDRAESCITLS